MAYLVERDGPADSDGDIVCMPFDDDAPSGRLDIARRSKVECCRPLPRDRRLSVLRPYALLEDQPPCLNLEKQMDSTEIRLLRSSSSAAPMCSEALT